MIDDRFDGDFQGRRGLFHRSVEERGRLAGQHGVGREGVHAALVNELGLRELLALHHGNDKLAEALRTLGLGGGGALRGVVSEPASRQKITQSPETKQTLLLKALFNRGFFLAP